MGKIFYQCSDYTIYHNGHIARDLLRNEAEIDRLCAQKETEMPKSSRTFTPQFYKLAQGHPSVTNSYPYACV